jgi:hypothetical protein
MHCEGKCCLARKLKEQEQQEQQAPNAKREKFEVQPFYLPSQFAFSSIHLSTKVEYPYTAETISKAYLGSVFHPPTV